ncbi:hypothetical protein B566_EDAN015797 [Ephemera danica]|nr:hypothetical protein B566_EDAN015797 [Ephemera danica]
MPHFIDTVFGLRPKDSLNTFAEMWYHMFLWALFSSIFVHVAAAAIAFGTLRKHRMGKFFPLFLLVMGCVTPLTSGSVSCMVIAFVYRTSDIQMAPLYAFMWGVGQTVLLACIGVTRILATL